MKSKRAAIIPAYNEGASIGGVLQAIRARHADLEMIVVDDGSTDETAAIAREHGAIVIRHQANLGIGAAVGTALLYLERKNYQAAIRLDADGQHPAELIEQMLGRIESGEADLVIGSRFLEGGRFQWNLARSFGNWFLAMLLRLLTGHPCTDPTSGFQAFSPEAIAFLSVMSPSDYPEPTSLLLAAKKGFVIEEVPVRMAERTAGTSSITTPAAVFYMFRVSLGLIMGRLRS